MWNFRTPRSLEMIRQLPLITKSPDKTNLVFGYSTAQFFLNPEALDRVYHRHGSESKSYNLAMAGYMGMGQYIQLLRLAKEFSGLPSKFRASIFEFHPLSYSQDFHRRHERKLKWIQPADFFTAEIILELIKVDPFMALPVIFNRYIQPPSMDQAFPNAFWRTLEVKKQRGPWPGMAALFGQPRFDDALPWNPESGGMSNWGGPAMRSEFERAIAALHKGRYWTFTVNRMRDGSSLNSNFRVDTKALSLFVSSVKLAKQFSDKVYVFMMPVAPALQLLVNRFVDSEKILTGIRSSADVEVIDLTDSFKVSDDDFADPFHPKHETTDRFVEVLVERILAAERRM